MRIHTALLGMLTALVLASGLLAACGEATPAETTAPPQEEPPADQPASGEGAALLEERCTGCHGVNRVTAESKTQEEWEQTVARMIRKGAELNEDEQAILVQYLAETYGP
jgi:cytochrome c5